MVVDVVPPQPTNDHAQERVLVRRAQKGDADALHELVVRHQQRLFAFLWRVLRDHHETEEVCQETFVRAFENLGNFSPEYRFSTWLFTIGYRMAINYRKKKRPSATDDEYLGTLSTDRRQPDDDVAGSESAKRIKDQLWQAVDALSLPQKTAVYLFYREELTCEQIADVLNCAVDTVKSHLHRGRARLREALEPTLGGKVGMV